MYGQPSPREEITEEVRRRGGRKGGVRGVGDRVLSKEYRDGEENEGELRGDQGGVHQPNNQNRPTTWRKKLGEVKTGGGSKARIKR